MFRLASHQHNIPKLNGDERVNIQCNYTSTKNEDFKEAFVYSTRNPEHIMFYFKTIKYTNKNDNLTTTLGQPKNSGSVY